MAKKKSKNDALGIGPVVAALEKRIRRKTVPELPATTWVQLPTAWLEPLRQVLLAASPNPACVAGVSGIDAAMADNAMPDREAKIDAAREIYQKDGEHEVRIDDDASFSEADDAYWVTAWVRVPHEDGGK